MAKKAAPSSAAPSAPSTGTATPIQTTTNTIGTPSAAPAVPKKIGTASSNRWDQIALNIVEYYQKNTPQRTKLIDVFMVFLVAVGGLQFLYCILAGNYPFNAFLSGFGATVGQFVLTASLRIQTTEANKPEFPAVSHERAFADYVVGSLILHFFVINFIN
ncbi:DAD family-domain-containing protein [Truncatella angustata]|uniref:Dolichyl-diphosphooligosaccharide--protein glycosyltransferase subunit OST2 n=1 Tax=Truncatella angustata TaxID=152316 RepID=A0A9P9A3A0_9PEZI|nr:DAD family-domain-containing protein [Truncatella angustata]KAH6659928.1 DAD family-domain-containing protein [Truncatella angustata]